MREKVNKFIEKYTDIGNNIFNGIENIKSKTKFDKTIFFIFIAIFLILYFTNSVVYMYFDDFGNASLSYAYWTPNVEGTEYTIPQLIEWAKQIYMNWGGRILYAIAFIIPLLKKGINTYMLVQSIVITLMLFYMYKIINIFTNNKDSKGKNIIPIALMALYMCIDMTYLRHGIYWASASVLYIWPMLPFVAFIYYYIKNTKKIEQGVNINFIIIPILMILCFLATFSQEQIGAGMIAFIVTYIIFHHFRNIKKYLIIDVPITITAIGSFLLLFLAPGNWARMDTNVKFSGLGFFEKIECNYPEIIKSIFIDKINIYMIILTIIMFYMIFSILIEKCIKKGKKRYSIIFFIIPILLINYILVDRSMNDNFKTVGLTVFGTLWFISMFIISIIYFRDRAQIGILSIEFAAISTIFCLVMSPVVGGRTCIPYMLLIIMLTVLIMQDILNNKRIVSTIVIYLILIGTMLYGTRNTIENYEGYKRNYGIHQLNFELLQNYKLEDGNQITLYKIGNNWYGSTLSYEEPSMDFWIKEYFNIPQEVTFYWVDIYEPLR